MSTAISDTNGEKFAAICIRKHPETRTCFKVHKKKKKKNKLDVISRERKMNKALFYDVYEIF